MRKRLIYGGFSHCIPSVAVSATRSSKVVLELISPTSADKTISDGSSRLHDRGLSFDLMTLILTALENHQITCLTILLTLQTLDRLLHKPLLCFLPTT